jgi:hypothetical protein
MSGGHFQEDNPQTIANIADKIQMMIDDYEEGFIDIDYHSPDEIFNKFRIAVQVLRAAYVYANRIDYLVSGDDGNENFLKRLHEDLAKIEDGNDII